MNCKDNPGDFSNKVGYDLYVNPWWALRTLEGLPSLFVTCLEMSMGEPKLWFNGIYHELLWARDDIERNKKIVFHSNLSCNGNLYKKFWLPWRGIETVDGIRAANILIEQIEVDDIPKMELYISRIV